MLHDVAGDISIPRFGVGVYHPGFRKGLKTEFAVKPMVTPSVPFKGLSSVPNPPEVSISPSWIVCIIPVASRRVRAGGPVIPLRIRSSHHSGQEPVEEALILLPAHLAGLPIVANKTRYHLYLIVPAPERQRGMVSQSPDVILRL